MFGFHGESKFSLKLTLDAGLPSIANLIDQNLGGGGFSLGVSGPGLEPAGASIAGAVFLLGVVAFLLSAFVEAGFIGLLHEAVQARPASFERFLQYGRKFWLRLFGVGLVAMVFMVLVGAISLLVLKEAGIAVVAGAYLVLRVLYIYWEFTIVVKDDGLWEGFTRSREHFNNRPAETAEIIGRLLISISCPHQFIDRAPSGTLQALASLRSART